MRRYFVAIFCFLPLILSLFPSCRPFPDKQIIPAFYFWRSSFSLSPREKRYLTGRERLYIRLFDVVWNDVVSMPVPESPLQLKEGLDSTWSYVPVVFITNETLRHCSLRQMPRLADHILQKINSMTEHSYVSYREIQIDCDWTVSTRERYFLLLKQLHERLSQQGKMLSVTLRLHQIKFPEITGLPPADRGMLMFYNMGDWKNPQTRNSILNLPTANQYMKRINDYPLPLDIALPLLRWTIVYRKDKFLTFINYVASDSLKLFGFLKQLGDNRFSVKEDTFALGCRFRQGDLLRSESCDFSQLMQAKAALLHRIKNRKVTVSLFHLDSQLLKYYTYEQIQKIFSAAQ